MSSLAGDDLEPRGESPTRASSAKKPRTAGRTLRSTRTRPRLQQLRARKPGMKSPGKPLVLAKQANRRRDVQAVLSSNRGATSTGQQSRGNGKVLGHRSTSTFSRVTSRPNKDQQESSSESLSSVEDHSEAQVPHTETGLQPPKSRKWKRVDDMDRVSSKKSHQIEDSQNNERKRRQPNERPKKRRRGL
ncbi:hypothetical protein VNI00_012411 [Paramarasmius palmivorus]|uniref:Uncharacterized protein n=1 Tax=Paramarasmius palmivorus TaxID=297713 RepID=A0AAW0C7V0_9AGAR